MKCDKVSQGLFYSFFSILAAVAALWLISPIHHGLVLITWVIIGSGVFFPVFRKLYHLCVINDKEQVLFLLAAFVLLVLPICHFSNAQNDKNENRRLVAWPEVSIKAFYDGTLTEDLENFFNDRFFGRQALLSLHNNLSFFGGSGEKGRLENARAIEGNNGWVFYKGERSIELYQNKLLYSDEQYKIIKEHLVTQKQWLNAHDVAYFCIIAPNKEDMYGEYLPGIKKLQFQDTDRIGLLMKYLEANNAECIPVFPYNALQAAKTHDDNLLYYKTDTHWSELGAYIGYLELMKQVKEQYPNLEILAEDDMSFAKTKQYDNGDLANMLGADYTEQMKDVHYIVPEPINGWHYEVVEEEKNESGRLDFFRTINPNGKLKVMVFRDSFTTALSPYLSETFHEVLYYWDHNMDIHTNDVLREKPDIVIAETVSRGADSILLHNKFREVGN